MALGHSVVDVGAHSYEPLDDYPDFAEAVGNAVAHHEVDRGVVICGSGVGASIAANKIVGVRAGICTDTYSGHQGVEHDDMNVIVLGARVIGSALAFEVVNAFIGARFIATEERFVRRFKKVLAIEAKYMCGDGPANPA